MALGWPRPGLFRSLRYASRGYAVRARSDTIRSLKIPGRARVERIEQ